jgi:hypothetical protein
MKTVFILSILALTTLLSQPIHAQNNSGPLNPPADNAPAAQQPAPPPSGDTASAKQAVDIARSAVDPSLQDRIVSVYGVGTPQAITRWWVIFYDPSVPSHGRAVRVENGQVVKAYEAKGGVIYSEQLTFPRSWVTNAGPALAAASDYAAQHNISYDSSRALLRITASGQALRWRVEMMNGETNRGFVFSNASNGAFAMYASADTTHSATHVSTGNGGGVVGDARKFGNDVKHTFLGIGGDLQEFFTGERTVDQ